MRWHKLSRLKLHTKIFIGLISGVVFGLLAGKFGFSDFVTTYIDPVGKLFIRLISMVVIPLVFASLLVGTASLDDIRKLGRIGIKTIAFYLCTTAVAVTIGLVLANTVKPGLGLSEQAQQKLKVSAQTKNVDIEQIKKPTSVSETLLNIIPKNPIKSFTEGRMLQIIFFAIMCGTALTLIPIDKSKPVTAFFIGLNEMIIQIVHLVMKIAPYGVFALIASVVSNFGLNILMLLIKFSLVVLVGLLIHTMITYPAALKIFNRKISIGKFFRAIRPAQLIGFSSSSSSATLPVTMECVEENLGVSNEVASFVLPLGATINMDGTALYQGVAAVFIAQVYKMDLTVVDQLTIVLTATLASIGTAGVPSVGIITMAMVLRSIGVPIEGIALIMGVERILDMSRTVVNVTGDACCAAVVSASENRSNSP